MPRHRTAELCRFPLPTGQYCGQIALKGEYFCRHHWRLYIRSQAEMSREEAMEQLAARLQSLDLSDLLQALSAKLLRLHSTLRTLPEARIALAVTIDRLQSIQTAPPQPSPAPIDFPENSMESMSQHRSSLQNIL